MTNLITRRRTPSAQQVESGDELRTSTQTLIAELSVFRHRGRGTIRPEFFLMVHEAVVKHDQDGEYLPHLGVNLDQIVRQRLADKSILPQRRDKRLLQIGFMIRMMETNLLDAALMSYGTDATAEVIVQSIVECAGFCDWPDAFTVNVLTEVRKSLEMANS